MLLFFRIMRSTWSQRKFSAGRKSQVSETFVDFPKTIARGSRLQVNVSFNTAVW